MEKAFKCNHCSQEFNSRSKLKCHILRQHEGIRSALKKKFKCTFCDHEMYQKTELASHIRKHIGERPFNCAVDGCGKSFKLGLTLKNHIKYKHSDERPFNCKFPGCRFKAKTDVTLIGHMKVHSSDRPFACPNTGCKFRGRERSHVARHVKSVHIKVKTIPCSKCDYRTDRSDSLKTHMTYRHSTRRDFKCSHPKCEESFQASLDLKRHISNRHKERNVQCDHPGCGRKYGSASALYKHKWDYHSKKNLPCPHSNCSYRTNKMRKLTAHMIVHVEKNEKIPCPIKDCEYKGKNDRAVEWHMRRHENLLKCPVSGCSRYAFTQKALNNHLKLHSALDRPFQCPMCFKFYTTRDQLKTHSVVHTKEKPFICGHCEYGSLSQGGVNRPPYGSSGLSG